MLDERISESVRENREKLNLEQPIHSISISSLGRGENSTAFLVSINGKRKLVYKIGLKETRGYLKHEFEILSSIPHDMGPEPLFFDETKTIFSVPYSVLSLIEGRKLSRWHAKHLILHAGKLASLHKKRFSFCELSGKKYKTFDPSIRLRDDMKVLADALTDRDVHKLFPLMENYVESHRYLFASQTRYPLIHGDPCVDNILFSRNDVRYIDWEYAGIRDGAEDLARFFYEDRACPPWMIRLNGERLNFFLDCYQKCRRDATLLERVQFWNLYIRFTDFAYFKSKILSKRNRGFSKGHYTRAARSLGKELMAFFQLKK